jgi:hypothetical protein
MQPLEKVLPFSHVGTTLNLHLSCQTDIQNILLPTANQKLPHFSSLALALALAFVELFKEYI